MQTLDKPLLEVRNLRKEFHLHLLDGRVIEPLTDLSFSSWGGKLLMIGGRSGAGKTTILKCIYRTYKSTAGEILYNSAELGQVDLASASEATVLKLRERELGYCSQFLKVLPRLTALEVAAEPLMRQGMSRMDALEQAAGWLARLKIEESRWQAYPVTFSGGEQQRLNLARAFIAVPRLLLLDEPTASLDAKSKEVVLEMIDEAKARGVAIITVSHDSAAIEHLANETMWL